MTIGAVMGRFGALVLALLLVLGALLWRGRGDGAADPDGTDDPPVVATDTVRCATELGICQALAQRLGGAVDVVTEDGVTTARALQDAEATEAWVTLSSLVDVVEESRSRASRGDLFADEPGVVGTSPLVLAGRADRMAALEGGCGLTWACLGQVAGQPWADHGGEASWQNGKPGLADPTASGIGLLTLGQAVASQLDGAVVSTRTLDVPEVAAWFAQLAREARTPSEPLRELIQFPGTLDVVGLTEADAASVLSRAAAPAVEIAVAPSSPPVQAEVVVAAPHGAAVPAAVTDAVAEVLSAAGWHVEGRTPGVTLPDPLDPAAGDPPALTGGALEAVLLRWEQAAR